MRDPVLPATMIAGALGLALGYSPRPLALRAVGAFSVTAVLTALVPLPGLPEDIVFAGCWLTVVSLAGWIHLSRPAGPMSVVLLALNGGLWTGGVAHLRNQPLDLVYALPLTLLLFPAAYLIGRGWGVAIKVAASWLIAIAGLEIVLPLVATPGYKPDHME